MTDLTPLKARIEAAEAWAARYSHPRPYVHLFVDEAKALVEELETLRAAQARAERIYRGMMEAQERIQSEIPEDWQ